MNVTGINHDGNCHIQHTPPVVREQEHPKPTIEEKAAFKESVFQIAGKAKPLPRYTVDGLTELAGLLKIQGPKEGQSVNQWIAENKQTLEATTKLDLSIREGEEHLKKAITHLPAELTLLSNLEVLDLRGNDLKEFPMVVLELKKLKELSFFKNKNCECALPAGIGALTALTKLDVGYMGVREVPDEIGNLVHLTELRFKTNKLRTLPETLGKLVNIEKLHLGENPWTSLPDVFASFPKVTELKLDEIVNQKKYKGQFPDNSKEFPQILESISKLPNLQKLDISKNQLTELPEIIKDPELFKKHFPHVTQITITGNSIDMNSLPEHLKDIIIQ